MSGYGYSTVQAHMTGDCWAPTCPLCEIDTESDGGES